MKMKLKLISTAAVAVTIAAGTAYGAAFTYSGPAGGDWSDVANWGGAYPGTGDYAILPTTATMSNSAPNNIRAIRVQGAGATLTVLNGANVQATTSSNWDSHIGNGSGDGTVNHSGGYLNFNYLEVGRQGTGLYNMMGGTNNIARGRNGYSLYLGTDDVKTLTGTGTYVITGGTLRTRVGLYLGSISGVGIGTFSVQGAGSTIDLGGAGAGDADWYQNSNSVLRVGISTNGVSPIVLDDDAGDAGAPIATLGFGSVLDVDFIDGAMETNSWPVLISNGLLNNNGMVFDPSMGAATNDWGFIVSNNTLYVGYGLGWPAGEDVVGPPATGRTLYWTGAGGDSDASNPTNWVENLDGGYSNSVAWGPYDDDTWLIGDYHTVDGGSTNVVDYDNTSTFKSQGTLSIGNRRHGVLNFNDGDHSFATSTSSRQNVGHGTTAGDGTLNVNGGAAIEINSLAVANNGAKGTVNVHAGTLTIGRATTIDGYSTSIAVAEHAAGGTGLVHIDGGRLFTRGGISLGAQGGHATFSVEGSAPTAISIGSNGSSVDGSWHSYSNSVLKIRLDGTATGVTPIQVIDDNDAGNIGNGDVRFFDGSTLDIGWMPGVTNWGTFDIMTWQGAVLTNALALATNVDTSVWSFEFVDTDADTTNDTLRATAYGETSNGTPIPWLIENGLTTDDDEVDNDGDGLLTWEEYVAGTSPTNSASTLAVTGAEDIGGGDFVITWQSVAGRNYSIITNVNLVIPAPGVEASGIVGLPTETSYTGSVNGAANVFYEIGVTNGF